MMKAMMLKMMSQMPEAREAQSEDKDDGNHSMSTRPGGKAKAKLLKNRRIK